MSSQPAVLPEPIHLVLSKPDSQALHALAGLTAQVCGVSMAHVRVGKLVQFWTRNKAIVPDATRLQELEQQVLARSSLFLIPENLSKDLHDPVSGWARFGAGLPLYDEAGLPIGCLIVLDRCPGRLYPEQEHALREVAELICQVWQDQERLQQRQERVNQLEIQLFKSERAVQHWNNATQELSQSLEVLRSAEARSRQITQTSALGMAVWEKEGTVVEANEAFLDLTGYSRADLVAGRILMPLVLPEGAPQGTEGFSALRLGSSLSPTVKNLSHRAGHCLPVLMSMSPLVGLQQQAIQVVPLSGCWSELQTLLSQPRPAAPAPKPVETKNPFSGQGEQILVVDDEASLRQLTRWTLEKFGYRVLTASNGVEALDLFRQHQATVALVLTDMMMPIMDGPATIQELRRISPTAPIIGVSGLAGMNYYGSMAQDVGANALLPKPFTADSLLRLVRQVLDRKSAA